MPLESKIVVGDLGSSDDTLDICSKYNVEFIEASSRKRCDIRNSMIESCKTPWIFYIEPWEILASGGSAIKNLKPDAYSVKIFQGDIITKETRIWHKSKRLKFIQPIYESLTDHESTPLPAVVLSSMPNIAEDMSKEIEEWANGNPISKEPYYYKAFMYLRQNRYDKFLEAAKEYLFREKTGMPSIMMQYYVSKIQFYMGNVAEASRGVVSCLVVKPLMAEFWCLLGDIYYKIKEYKKAICYYENALVLGKHRLVEDAWPIEISRYKTHPNKMIQSCKDIVLNSKAIRLNV